jgi:hypothetical protein
MQQRYEYRTTFAVVPLDFPDHGRLAEDLSRVSPKPPRGEDWQLVTATTAITNNGPVIFYAWERSVLGRGLLPAPPLSP